MSIFSYGEVMEYGFTRIEEGHDPVFYNENGYNYFIVEKKLGDNLILDWDSTDGKIELQRVDNFDECNIKKRHIIKSSIELKFWINFFTDE